MDRDNTISLQDMLLKAHRFHLAYEDDLSDAVDRKAAQLALEAVRLEERADTRPECSQLDAVVSGSLTAGHLRTQPEHRWAWEQIRDCRPAALQIVLAERQASNYMRDPWEYIASQLRLEFTFDPHDTKDRDSQGNPIDDTELFDDTMGNRLEMYCREARQGNSAVNRLSTEIARLNAHGWGQRLADRIKEQYPREWQEIMGPHGTDAASPPSEPADGRVIEDRFVFRRYGDGWRVHFRDEHGQFRDTSGFRIIHRLLTSPNSAKPISFIELLGGDAQATVSESRQVGMDRVEKSAIDKRLEDLYELSEKARTDGALAKLGEYQGEIARLIQQKQKDTGLGGKPRRLGPGSPTERARNAARKAIERAYTRLEEATPPMKKLGSHLRRSILADGDGFTYQPESLPDWQLT